MDVLKLLMSFGKPHGLTEENARALIEDLGITSTALLRYIEVNDLIRCGIKPAPARMIVEALQAGVPALPISQQLMPQEITVVVQQHKPIQEMVPSELIAIIANETDERRQDAAEEWDTRTRGNPAVVLIGDKIDVTKSLELFRTARATIHSFHGSDPVKTAKHAVSEKTWHDPMDDQVLVGGVNQHTLADWNDTADSSLVLIAWANEQGLLRGRNAVDVANELKGDELTGFWSKIKARLDNIEGVRPGTRARILAHITRPVDATSTLSSRASAPDRSRSHPFTGVARAELELFFSRYTNIRQFVFRHYHELLSGLPGENASTDTMASETVRALERHGLIDTSLFERFDQELPNRRNDILRVRQLCLGF
ncbi:MAG: hypothetical protein NUV56_01685 [Candidatus Uhrbacteria bacterium]|nr:hypothetical protein [Candidatus Uhrbacteria bacterium]